AGGAAVLWLANVVFEIVAIDWPVLGWLTFLAAAVVAGRAWVVPRRRPPAGADADQAPAALPPWLGQLGRYIRPAAVVFAIVMPFTPFADQRLVDLGIGVLTYIMLGWGLNVVVGLAGLLDLGYVAFYAVGAYAYAVMSKQFGLNFWETLPIAGAFAA